MGTACESDQIIYKPPFSRFTIVACCNKRLLYPRHVDGALWSREATRDEIKSLLVSCFTVGALEAEDHDTDKSLKTGLTRSYFTTKATSDYFPVAYNRLIDMGHAGWASFIAHKLDEEILHSDLVSQDLGRLFGLSAETVSLMTLPERSSNLIKILDKAVNGEMPLNCLGYAFVLEFNAIASANQRRDFKRSKCYEIHGGDLTESKHIDSMIHFIAHLPFEIQKSICDYCYETSKVFHS
jgi:hypothetical protein